MGTAPAVRAHPNTLTCGAGVLTGFPPPPPSGVGVALTLRGCKSPPPARTQPAFVPFVRFGPGARHLPAETPLGADREVHSCGQLVANPAVNAEETRWRSANVQECGAAQEQSRRIWFVTEPTDTIACRAGAELRPHPFAHASHLPDPRYPSSPPTLGAPTTADTLALRKRLGILRRRCHATRLLVSWWLASISLRTGAASSPGCENVRRELRVAAGVRDE
jgi:hypothetical protein